MTTKMIKPRGIIVCIMIKLRGIILHILTKPRGIALMTPHEMTFEHVAETAAVEVVLHVG